MGGTVRIDPESESVDSDVMVIPAGRDQIVGMVTATVLSFLEVVGLEPVTAGTALDRTLPLIPPSNERSYGGGDRLSQIGIGNRV